MKKLITTLVAVALLVSGSFAEIRKENLSIGVRGSVGASDLAIANDTKRQLGNEAANTMSDSTGLSASYSVDNEAVACGGFAFWANYSFPSLPALGLQAELGFLFNNGTELTVESKSGTAKIELKDKATYTTMELPFLVTYTVNKGGFFEFIPQAGFYLSFPLGKIKQDTDMKLSGAVSGVPVSYSESDSSKDKIDTACLLGFACGCDFAFNLSKQNAILLNMRYMHDFAPLKSDGEFGTRSVFLFSAGYRYSFR